MIVEIRHNYTHGIRAFKIWQAVSRGRIADLPGTRVSAGGLAVFYRLWMLGQRHEARWYRRDRVRRSHGISDMKQGPELKYWGVAAV